MQLLVPADPTAQSYWLSWRALLCEASVLFSIGLSLFLIWKYECLARDKSGSDEGEKWKDKSWSVWFDESWRPSVKELHPVVLAVFRLVAFILLAAALIADAIVHGGELFLYYTQWTFLLVTIYFLFGSLLSMYGCYQYYKTTKGDCICMDEEKSLHLALSDTQYLQGVNTGDNCVFQRVLSVPKSMGIFGYFFQILFQMTAGSVMLTDCLYWTVIFPFLTIKDYDLSFQTPWFRISYFLLWTGTYVIFQWCVHAFVSTWWPYPFLDMSLRIAPLWYVVVALMHIPCYGLVVLLVKLKGIVLSKWFHESRLP